MDDKDFLSLDPPAAQVALDAVGDEAEKQRLRQLYARTKGHLVDGTGWRPPGQPRSGARSWIQGRTNRAQYWFQLVIAAVGFTILVLLQLRVGIGEAVLILICVPRLHDVGLSGWYAAPPLVLEIALTIFALAAFPPAVALEISGVIVLAICALLVVLGALPGQKSDNAYGAPPRPGLSFGRQPDATQEAAAHFD